jgi:hypothetical protein
MILEKFKKYYSEDLKNPPYPFYHDGHDLESYFIQYYLDNFQEFKNIDRIFIPVKWTAIYNRHGNLLNDLQNDLNHLDKNKKYFTISQHDDAPYQNLPPDTLNFSAGGNIPNTIPIPLICSSIKNITTPQKDIFCSFVGSVNQNLGGISEISHNLRIKMLEVLVDNPKYVLKPKHWSPEINKNRQDLFLSLTSRSKFCLCPRGYGATSFRLYEAMQLQSVPVYIYWNEPFLPFSDEINWADICVLINSNNVLNIDNILSDITEEKYKNMIENIQNIYPKYFTLESMCVNILKRLK